MAQHSGEQPNHRVHQHHGRKRSVCEHIISNRDLVISQMLADTLIKSLVTSAHQNQMLGTRQFSRDRLIKPATLRRQQDGSRVVVFAERSDRIEQRFRLEQHPRSPSERAVINRMMTVVGVVPEVMNPQREVIITPRSSNNTLIQRAQKHSREERYNIDLHPFPFTVRRWPAEPKIHTCPVASERLGFSNHLLLILDNLQRAPNAALCRSHLEQ